MQPQSATSTQLKKKISLQDFQIKHIIGKGSYGDVFLVTKQNQSYAMKQIVKRKLQKQKKQYQAMVERELLRCMKHPGIIKLKYAFQDKNKLYFIMEYCHLGEFVRFIKEHIDHFTEQVRKFYIAEMVNLLEYLHSNGIAHRDLKPQNLLLSKDGHLKLIDFGTSEISQCKILSQQFKDGIEKQKDRQVLGQDQILTEQTQQEQQLMSPRKRRSTFVGTSYYISPQLLQQNICEPPSDLWALGCIIYQLYYFQTPFKDTTEYGVFEKIKKVQLQFPKNDIINENAIDLIKKLLIKNPQQRLGSCSRQQLNYQHLKKHPYFQGTDVNNIYSTVPPDVQSKKFRMLTQDEMEQRRKDFIEKAIKVLNQNQKQQKKVSQKDTSVKIIKEGSVLKRQFPYYQQSYMRLYSNGKIKLIKMQKPQAIEEYEIQQRKVQVSEKKDKNQIARLLDKEKGKFSIEMKDKKKQVFQSYQDCQEWIEKINKFSQNQQQS